MFMASARNATITAREPRLLLFSNFPSAPLYGLPKFNKQVQHFRFLGFRIMIADHAENLQTIKRQ